MTSFPNYFEPMFPGKIMPVTKSRLYQLAWKSFVERRSLLVKLASEGGVRAALFDPFRIFFTRHGWYIIGRSHAHGETRVLDPADVREVEIVENRFTIPPKVNLRRLIGSACRVTKEVGGQVAAIVRFSPGVARQVAAKKWNSPPQLRYLDDGSVELQACNAGIEDLVPWILSFGADAEVIEPESLRDRIRVQAENLVSKYSRLNSS